MRSSEAVTRNGPSSLNNPSPIDEHPGPAKDTHTKTKKFPFAAAYYRSFTTATAEC